MAADPTGTRISADLDAMIARAEELCERHRRHAGEAGLVPAVARNRRRKLLAMQLHLERLRARRDALPDLLAALEFHGGPLPGESRGKR
jgi:hypothetical protein